MRLALTFFSALLCLNTLACDGLKLEHVWLRQPPPGSEVVAAYFDAHNEGPNEVIIEAVASPDFSGAMFQAVSPVISIVSSGDESAQKEYIHLGRR